METIQLQYIAGATSTAIFVTSNLPMLFKAIKTRDLKSYSLSHLVLSNLGNLIHWVYVASLPFGPIWFLHGFFTLVTAVMLLWYFRFELVETNIIRSLQLKAEQMCICGCANDCNCVSTMA
jgi:uncharacterized protein with PQ loop repeat